MQVCVHMSMFMCMPMHMPMRVMDMLRAFACVAGRVCWGAWQFSSRLVRHCVRVGEWRARVRKEEEFKGALRARERGKQQEEFFLKKYY